MIKHIVCFKLKEGTDVEKTKEILLSMKGKVPEIKDIEVGVDFLHSERSYDIILQITLENEAALTDYQNDEYHCSVVKKHMHAVRTGSIAVDYEL
ncbi:MAG: Dabb family protein [Candidatus Borkfalkiaceae bacterium]|mgnify:FL=1|nr:Dabb family protein [Christensenellaceae bacterium]